MGKSTTQEETVKWILETEKEADIMAEARRREKHATREFWREVNNSTWKWLNVWSTVGLFADKYYHLVHIGAQFPPTGDHSLNMILFAEFLNLVMA